jgi:altronate dehydratase
MVVISIDTEEDRMKRGGIGIRKNLLFCLATLTCTARTVRYVVERRNYDRRSVSYHHKAYRRVRGCGCEIAGVDAKTEMAAEMAANQGVFDLMIVSFNAAEAMQGGPYSQC